MKISIKIGTIFISAAILAFSTSCGNKKTAENQAEIADTLITVSKTQFETEGMMLGTIELQPFEQVIKCNGKIVAKSNGTAKISAPVSGIVQKIYCSNGQMVKAGQAIFELSGNELIEIERDFAETSSQLKKSKSEFERIKALFSEKVGTEKEFIMAESEYKATYARYSALRLKLESIGLDAAKIENGEFFKSFKILAPISGQISAINLSIGQYADSQNYHAEITDSKQLQLQLAVFEKDAGILEQGQLVRFNLLSDTIKMEAELLSVGNMVENETKTVSCFASLTGIDKPLINNAFTEAEIIITTDSLNSIPAEAILKSENEYSVLKFIRQDSENYYFEKISVTPGKNNNIFTQVNIDPDGEKFLVRGVYNLVIE